MGRRKVIRQVASWGKVVVIGCVENFVLKKYIQGSKHFLRQPRAIAISASGLDEAEKAGAKVIEVTDTETNRVYSASFEHFRHNAFVFRRGGFEKQYALILEYWCIDGVEPRQLKVLKNIEAASHARQLSMFA